MKKNLPALFLAFFIYFAAVLAHEIPVHKRISLNFCSSNVDRVTARAGEIKARVNNPLRFQRDIRPCIVQDA